MLIHDSFKVIIRSSYKAADFSQKQRFKSDGPVKTDSSVLAKAHMERCEKTGTKLVSDVKKFNQFKQVRDSSGNLSYTETISRAKSMQSKFMTYGVFTVDAIGGVNSLFRNILLFKQINMAQIQADLAAFDANVRQPKLTRIGLLIMAAKANKPLLSKLHRYRAYWQKCKPFIDYRVNVTVEHDYHQQNRADQSLVSIKAIKVATIRVKRIIYLEHRPIGMLFDSASCRPVNLWLNSFTFSV